MVRFSSFCVLLLLFVKNAISLSTDYFDTLFSNFSIQDASMREFLQSVSEKSGIAYGYVQSKDDSVKVSLQGPLTIREMLDEGVNESGPYVWRRTGDTRILVLPIDQIEDANSFINLALPAIQEEIVTVREAISTVMELMHSRHDVSMGYMGSEGSGPRAISQRVIQFNTEPGTCLDVLQYIFNAAGDDTNWALSTNSNIILTHGHVSYDKVEIDALTRARAAAKSPDKTRESTEKLYLDAINQSIVPVALRTEMELANYLLRDPEDASAVSRAVPLLHDVLFSESPYLESCHYMQALSTLVSATCQAPNDAVPCSDVISTLIEGAREGKSFISEDFLLDSFINLQLHLGEEPTVSLKKLQNLRSKWPDYPRFQEKLATVINTCEQRVREADANTAVERGVVEN